MSVSLQFAQVGSERAADVIERSIDLSTATQQSWQETWNFALETTPLSLWGAIVRFSMGIAVFALIYMAIRYGNEIAKTKSLGAVIEMFLFPLTAVFLLGRDGSILAAIVRILRGVGQQTINSILSISMGGITLQEAIRTTNSNSLAIARIRQLYSQCDGVVGTALNTCFEDKTTEAQGIIDAMAGDLSGAQAFLNTIASFLQTVNPLPSLGQDLGNLLEGIAREGSLEGGFTQVIQDRLFPILQAILYAVQWAIANIMEAALLLSALFAPIAVALSLMPLAGRPIFAWLSGFISILAIQLGYNILVGLTAFVLVNIDGPLEAMTGFGFLIFCAIFAPFLAYQIGRGGGIALYQGISRRAASMTDAVTGLVSLAIRFL